MWILKLKIKHDCSIGNRCEKFSCSAYSIPLGNWEEGNIEFTSERHTIEGNPEDVKKFINDLRKDKRISKLEVVGNTLFFIGRRKGEKIPSSFYNPKIFFVKPVIVDKKGYEYWEIANWDKRILNNFINKLKEEKNVTIEILKFKNTKLNNIYFTLIMPLLTERQKRALELAIEYGYYDIPKRTDLKKLAKVMKISLSTYQEHLKRAEAKTIPKIRI